jgi:hypothetical protein
VNRLYAKQNWTGLFEEAQTSLMRRRHWYVDCREATEQPDTADESENASLVSGLSPAADLERWTKPLRGRFNSLRLSPSCLYSPAQHHCRSSSQLYSDAGSTPVTLLLRPREPWSKHFYLRSRRIVKGILKTSGHISFSRGPLGPTASELRGLSNTG